MQTLLDTIDADDFRAYIVFMPMLEVDDLATAKERMAEYSDSRLTYFWDPEFISGHTWREVLDIDIVAWDVYFLYGADATWKERPTQPMVAMTGHQAIEDKIHRLHIDKFAGEAKKMLKR